jgi:hypothetical protein
MPSTAKATVPFIAGMKLFAPAVRFAPGCVLTLSLKSINKHAGEKS